MPNKMTLQNYCDLLGLYAAKRPDDTSIWWSFTERPYLSNGGYTLQDGAKTAKILSKNVVFPKCKNWRESMHSPHGRDIIDVKIIRENPDALDAFVFPGRSIFQDFTEPIVFMAEFKKRRKEAIIKELAEMIADGKISICRPKMSMF